MFTLSTQDPAATAGGILLLYLVLHFIVGAALLRRAPKRLFLWALMEGAGHEIARRLNRSERTPAEKAIRGAVALTAMLFFAFLLGHAADRVAAYPFGWVVTVLLLAASLSAMGPVALLRRVQGQLTAGDLAGATELLALHAGEDLTGADRHALVRKAIETAVTQLGREALAPALFFLLWQNTGLVIYVTIAALERAYGRPEPASMAFASSLRVLDRVIGLIPAVLAAGLLALAALVTPRAHPLQAVLLAWRQAREAESKNRGAPVAAAAGALQVTLGGPLRFRSGYALSQGWIGPASSSARLTEEALPGATMLYFIAFLWMITLIAGLVLLQYKYS